MAFQWLRKILVIFLISISIGQFVKPMSKSSSSCDTRDRKSKKLFETIQNYLYEVIIKKDNQAYNVVNLKALLAEFLNKEFMYNENLCSLVSSEQSLNKFVTSIVEDFDKEFPTLLKTKDVKIFLLDDVQPVPLKDLLVSVDSNKNEIFLSAVDRMSISSNLSNRIKDVNNSGKFFSNIGRVSVIMTKIATVWALFVVFYVLTNDPAMGPKIIDFCRKFGGYLVAGYTLMGASELLSSLPLPLLIKKICLFSLVVSCGLIIFKIISLH